jgi:hypothetical protein
MQKLPYDLLQSFIIPRYFLDHIRGDRDLDNHLFPVMLLVLQLVNKQFNNVIRKCSLAWKVVLYFRYYPSSLFSDEVARMLRRACKQFGSTTLLEWLSEKLRYPVLQHECYLGAAKGTEILMSPLGLAFFLNKDILL